MEYMLQNLQLNCGFSHLSSMQSNIDRRRTAQLGTSPRPKRGASAGNKLK